ncbi:MAG TPA: hypothetical protein VEX41_00095 [Candidatus Eisenbacteria bacterium]|nr:hypothetical protein [Candidatus Eisenbacteria bacterium]
MQHRAFLGLTEIAGYFGALSVGLERAGIPCYQLDESHDPFSYRGSGPQTRIGALLGRLQGGSGSGPRAIFTGPLILAVRIARLLHRLLVLAYALLRCDIFILNGYGFFRARELVLLRMLRKKVVWVFTGSDHRPPYLNARAVRASWPQTVAPLIRDTAWLRRRIRLIEGSKAIIIAHSASAQLHARPFVQFLAVGIPVDIPPDVKPGAGRPPEDPVRLVHSPSDPLGKGTDRIRSIVDELRSEGLAIDYVEIIGRPHREVLQALANADILVDEVYSDTPLGVLGTEAAWYGVPTISGGYYADELHHDLPHDLIPPCLFVPPDGLSEAVRRLVVDRGARLALGARAAQFVRSRWTPELVAQRYLQVIDGRAPTSWIFDPRNLSYVGGWGMPDQLRQEVASAVAETAGVVALGLDGTPQLLGAIVAQP